MLIAIVQSLVHAYDTMVTYNNNLEDMNYEILNDAFWKATRFNFDATVTDCFDGTRLTLKDYVYKMIDTIHLSLSDLGNKDIITTLEHILESGTEADEQINFEKENGKNKLLLYLMNNVEYDI
jgi:gamma-glutamyl:cysteine ligase YbdK (ATP-grasp superfamily)